MKPLVSIVLPTYNGEKYIAKSIDSCLNQTYKGIELIIVDDASIDGTSEIVKRYGQTDKRIRFLQHKTNQRLPAALNTGFNAAQGTYLTWTSDDNLYKENAIAEMLSFLEANQSIDIVCTKYTTIDSNDCIIEENIAGILDELIILNTIGCCFLYRRKVQDMLKEYKSEYFGAEDYEFWMRAKYTHNFKFALLPLDLYKYRMHQKSLTSTIPDHVLKHTYRIIDYHLKTSTAIPKKYKVRAHLRSVRLSEKMGNRKNAIKHFVTAFFMKGFGVFKINKELIRYVFLGIKPTEKNPHRK